jgi:Ser/Thr protein kinase RdoA (MazF antagonist)
MTLEDHLPPHLRGSATKITKIAAGLSGASVYRVDAAGERFVLKVAGERDDAGDWANTLRIQQCAAEAGVTPRVVHVDEPNRAVLTAFVVDRSFAAFYRGPRTRETALAQLGRTVRRIHALPIPADARTRDPGAFLDELLRGARAGFALPEFTRDAMARAVADAPRTGESPLVLGHNDLNPSNLVYDGDAILLLDWAAAGPADAFYDLAMLATFLRMGDASCKRLLSAYEGTLVSEIPQRFTRTRRLAAAVAGALLLRVACAMKHPGATSADTLDASLSLEEFYQRMKARALKLGTPEGQWAFGLALVKESLSF